MEILDIVTRWPGSTHDSRIFNNSRLRMHFERRERPGLLLGDRGYPQLEYLFTPLLHPETPAEVRYNTAHRVTRCTVERLFGIWKRRFSCLGQKLRTNLATTSHIIAACAVLHNIAVRNGEPLPPEDEDVQLLPEVPVAAVRVNRNRSALIRAAFIERHFAH